jgi:hypothetical protein
MPKEVVSSLTSNKSVVNEISSSTLFSEIEEVASIVELTHPSSLKKSIIPSDEVSSITSFLTSVFDFSQKLKISSSESEFMMIKSSSCQTLTAIKYILKNKS